MSLDTSLLDTALEELTAGHLALDRIGAPREVWEGDIVRELTLAERIEDLRAHQLHVDQIVRDERRNARY